MYAQKAKKEGLPQIAHLFRVIAQAEAVHAQRNFALLEAIGDTQTNLEKAFQSETTVGGLHYQKMLQEAEEDDEKTAVNIFTDPRCGKSSRKTLQKSA